MTEKLNTIHNKSISLISKLETLYAIYIADLGRANDTFTYLNTQEMSTRDVIRVTVMRLRDMKRPLSTRQATDRLKLYRNTKQLGKIGTVESIELFTELSSYRPFGAGTGKNRIIYTLTPDGKMYIEERLHELKEIYPDTFEGVETLPAVLKKELMPNGIYLTDSYYTTDKFKEYNREKMRRIRGTKDENIITR